MSIPDLFRKNADVQPTEQDIDFAHKITGARMAMGGDDFSEEAHRVTVARTAQGEMVHAQQKIADGLPGRMGWLTRLINN